MKRNLLVTIVACCVLAFAGTGWAIPSATVGSLDDLIASATVANSYAAELAWIQSELGPSAFFAESDVYDVVGTDWDLVDGTTDWYATELVNEPANYFIKIGTGGLDPVPVDHYLYSNLAEFSFAVIDLSDIVVARNFDIGRVSHIGEVGTTVPEPGTLVLLGIGMLGVAVYRRKIY